MERAASRSNPGVFNRIAASGHVDSFTGANTAVDRYRRSCICSRSADSIISVPGL